MALMSIKDVLHRKDLMTDRRNVSQKIFTRYRALFLISTMCRLTFALHQLAFATLHLGLQLTPSVISDDFTMSVDLSSIYMSL